MSEAATVETTGEDERRGARTVRLRIPTAAGHDALPRLVLGGLALLVELPDEVLAELKAALTEAVAEVGRRADGHPVEIAYELAEGELYVDVGAEGAARERLGSPRRSAGADESGDGLPVPVVTTVADDAVPVPAPAAARSRLRFLKRLRADG